MTKRFPLLTLTLTATLLAILVWPLTSCRRGADDEEEPEVEPLVTVRVAEAALTHTPSTVVATGHIEALPDRDARISAQIGGKLTRVAVHEGDRVSAGQVLAEVYNQDLVAAVREAEGNVQALDAAATRARKSADQRVVDERALVVQAEAALRQAEADLERLRTGARSQEIAQAEADLRREEAKLSELEEGTRPEEIAAARRDLEAERAVLARLENGAQAQEIEAARAALAAEQAELDKLRSGARPQERAEAKSRVESTRVALTTAEETARRKSRLYDEGIVSLADKQAADAALASARAEHDAASQQLAMLEEGTREEDIRAQEARVEQARAQRDLVASGTRPELIEEQQARVRSAEEALRQAEAGPRAQEIAQQRADTERARQALDLIKAAPRSEDVRAAEARVADARAELDRARAGRFETEAYQSDIRAADGRRTEALGALAVARSAVERSIIRAPVSAVVGRVTANMGETVSAGEPFIDLVDLQAVQLRAQVPLEDLPVLSVGLTAEISVEGITEDTFQGTIMSVAPDVDPDSGTGVVLLYLPNDGRIKEGMFATAHIAALESETVVVPEAAVISREAETYVVVVDADSIAHETTVELGETVDGQVEVTSGLEGGESVVVEGGYGLPDGAEVSVAP